MTKLSKFSWLTTGIVLIGGFLLVYFGIADYGTTFFIIFPMAVGFAIGTHDRKSQSVFSVIFGVMFFFGLLLIGRMEGAICVLMALPLFLLMVYIGYKVQQKTIKEEPNESQKLMVSIAPILLLLLINPIEQILIPKPKIVSITNSIILNYSPKLVFDEVKQMDKLDADKPMGLILGLPSPYKCELEADTIGAKRTCLFKNGSIVAEITKFEKGEVLEMDVISYSLTGRDWFEFVDAKYLFEEINGKTKITRTSSYKSILSPRIYWQPLEKWGIEQEHKFVLNSLKKNLNEKYGM